jgi:hypothetical protein
VVHRGQYHHADRCGGELHRAGRQRVCESRGDEQHHQFSRRVGKANGTAITFPAATGSWGTITHIGGFTASTGGTVVWWGALSASKAIDNGDTFSIPIGDLDLTLD